jgi:hypothetical protein
VIRAFVTWRARKRLQRMVDQARNSFEREQYRRRRAAALKTRRI